MLSHIMVYVLFFSPLMLALQSRDAAGSSPRLCFLTSSAA